MKIGVIGAAGSGKDTVASIIQQQLNQSGMKAGICRFAEPIKAIAREVFGPEFDGRDVKEVLVPLTNDMRFLAEAVLWDAGKRLLGHKLNWESRFGVLLNRLLVKDEISPRIFQQYVGTDLFRAIDSSVWVNATQEQANQFEVALLPDVRFEDEAKVCDVLIVINRPGVGGVAEHVSERLANTLLSASFPKLVTRAHDITRHGKSLNIPVSIENYRRCTVGELRNSCCLGEFSLFEGKPQWFFSVFNHYSIERLEFMLNEVVMPKLLQVLND